MTLTAKHLYVNVPGKTPLFSSVSAALDSVAFEAEDASYPAPLREDAQALAETAVDEYAVIYDVQCRPAYFAPMQQSGETVQVTLREILRVDHLRQGVIAATRTSVDHTLTLRRQTDGSWQVCGDSYEALGHACSVTP